MIIFKQAAALQNHLIKIRAKNNSIGFVPTMGALHNGHIALIKESKEKNNLTVASIFVNPTQFNDKVDFEKYPVTIAEDLLKLENVECDILFLPTVTEIYPNGMELKTRYELGDLETIYEGAFRPGHFQGVCQVVDRLLSIVQPDELFMGQKDYQQCMVIQKLIELKKYAIQLRIVQTQRELSGLAMSSRNTRLNKEEINSAISIYNCLTSIKENYKKEPFEDLANEGKTFLLNNGFSKVDYVSIADANSLIPATKFDNNKKMICLIAAFIGEVRLIDNMLLD